MDAESQKAAALRNFHPVIIPDRANIKYMDPCECIQVKCWYYNADAGSAVVDTGVDNNVGDGTGGRMIDVPPYPGDHLNEGLAENEGWCFAAGNCKNLGLRTSWDRLFAHTQSTNSAVCPTHDGSGSCNVPRACPGTYMLFKNNWVHGPDGTSEFSRYTWKDRVNQHLYFPSSKCYNCFGTYEMRPGRAGTWPVSWDNRGDHGG